MGSIIDSLWKKHSGELINLSKQGIQTNPTTLGHVNKDAGSVRNFSSGPECCKHGGCPEQFEQAKKQEKKKKRKP